jgi:hypothetical protein
MDTDGAVLNADASSELFRTGWFVESLLTIVVIMLLYVVATEFQEHWLYRRAP